MQHVSRLSIVAALGLALLAAGGAAAKDKDHQEKAAPQPAGPVAPEYLELIAQGSEAYVVKDFKTALIAYKKAAEKNSKSPLPHYYIGCSQRAMSRYDEAVAAFKTANLLAPDDPWLRGIIAYNIALSYEAAGKLEQAAQAWQDFIRLAEGSKTLGKFVENAQARIDAIDKVLLLRKQYQEVRDRIAKEPSA